MFFVSTNLFCVILQVVSAMVDSVPMVLLPPHSASPLFSGMGGPVSPMLARMGLLLSFRERGLVPLPSSPVSPNSAEGPFDLSKSARDDADEDEDGHRSESGDGSSSSSAVSAAEQPLDLRVVKRKNGDGSGEGGGQNGTMEDENRNLVSVLTTRPGSRHSSSTSPIAAAAMDESSEEAVCTAATTSAAAGRLFPLNYSLVCDSLPLLPPYKYHAHHSAPSPSSHQRAIYERFEKSLRLPASHHLSLSSALYGAAAAAAAAHQSSFATVGSPHSVGGGHPNFGGGGGGGSSGGAPPSRDLPVVQKSLKAMLGGGGSISKPNKERYG